MYSHHPQSLSPGDRIAIIATARKIGVTEVIPARKVLESWGLEVVYGPNLFAIYNQFAGTDQQRADDLQWALDDASIKAIICVRGGYGTVRMIDLVDFSSFQKHPKWVAGYSDVTALHQRLDRLNIPSIHSTMPINFSKNKDLAKKEAGTFLLRHSTGLAMR